MKVGDVMTVDVVSAREDTPFKELVELMLENVVSALPILDDRGIVVGIVTEADLLGKEAYGGHRPSGVVGFLTHALGGGDWHWRDKARGMVARDLMSGPVMTAAPSDSTRMAARTMLQSRIKRLPVVEDGRLVGVVARADLLGVFHQDDQSLRTRIEDLVRRCFYVEPQHDVTVGVVRGVVTLQGVVYHQSDVRVLGAIVEAAEGVIGVENRLTFRHEDPT